MEYQVSFLIRNPCRLEQGEFVMKKISVFIVCLMLFSAAYAAAQYQEIILIPDNSNHSVGSQLSVTVQYDASDSTLTSLGVRIHFDSDILTYTGYEYLFETGTLADPQLQDDTENRDNDVSTDKMIIAAYTDINGNWPNRSLPLNLLKLFFTAETEGNTAIRATKTTGAAGFDFYSTEAEIIINDTPDTYTLTKSASPASCGSVSASPNKTAYTEGESVTLTATPNSGYKFDHWEGDLTGNHSSVKVFCLNRNNLSRRFSTD